MRFKAKRLSEFFSLFGFVKKKDLEHEAMRIIVERITFKNKFNELMHKPRPMSYGELLDFLTWKYDITGDKVKKYMETEEYAELKKVTEEVVRKIFR